MFLTMKSVYLLVLVSLCQGLPLDSKGLAAPHILRVNILDPPAIETTWNKIESGDVKDPVIGYKVKVWEVQNTTNTLFVVVNGNVEEIIKTQEQPIDLLSELGGSPDEIQVPADVTTAVYRKVKIDVTYEVRVQAYTKTEEGPLSDPVRVKLLKP